MVRSFLEDYLLEELCRFFFHGVNPCEPGAAVRFADWGHSLWRLTQRISSCCLLPYRALGCFVSTKKKKEDKTEPCSENLSFSKKQQREKRINYRNTWFAYYIPSKVSMLKPLKNIYCPGMLFYENRMRVYTALQNSASSFVPVCHSL